MYLSTSSVILFAASLTAAVGTTSATGYRNGFGNRGLLGHHGLQVPFGGFQSIGVPAGPRPSAINIPRISMNRFDGVRNFVPFNNEFPGRQQLQDAPNFGNFAPGSSPASLHVPGIVQQPFLTFPHQPLHRPAFGGLLPDNVGSLASEICPSYCYAQTGLGGSPAQDVASQVVPNTVTRVENVVRAGITKSPGGSSDSGLLSVVSTGSQAKDQALGAVSALGSNVPQQTAPSTSTSTSATAAQVSGVAVSAAPKAQPAAAAAAAAAAPVVAAPVAPAAPAVVQPSATSPVATSSIATGNSATSTKN